MKIAVIASLVKPYARGGAEVVVQTIIDELKKENEIIVITISPWKGFISLSPMKTYEDGVSVYRFYPFNIFSFIDINAKSFFLRIFWHILDICNMHSAWAVFKILEKEKPDVVMVHSVKGMGYTIPFVVQRTGILNIFTAHDVQLIVPSGQYMGGEESNVKKKFLLRIYRTLTKFLFGSPWYVVYPSRFLRDFYDVYGFFQRSKKNILPNPIDACVRHNEIHLLQKDEPISFLYLGQLEGHKGILFLLEVFKNWHAPDVRLMIAGSGSREDAVRVACDKDSRISFFGYTSGSSREELFERTQYIIVPSVCYENAPLVIGEALSRGIPVITAKIGGAYELVQDEKNGWVFIPGDTEDCIRALFEAHRVAHTRYQELSLCAKDSVKKYTVQKYCEQLLSITKDHVGSIANTGGKIRE